MDKYEALKVEGAGPEEVTRVALKDDVGAINIMKLLRQLFKLRLPEAKYMVLEHMSQRDHLSEPENNIELDLELMQDDSVNIHLFAQRNCICGEGPIWSEKHQRLYWNDIPNGRLFSKDPLKDFHEQVAQSDFIGGTTFQEDGSLLLFGDQCSVKRWDGEEIETVFEGIPGETRFNDVAADVKGRVYAGAMPVDAEGGGFERLGRLYCFELDGSYRVVEEGVQCANGIGFSPDHRTMYFADSGKHVVYAYDYDPESGERSNRCDFYTTAGDIVPDGLTVDAAGHVWVALWEGSGVIELSDSGDLLRYLKVPTPWTTSCCFGGKDLDRFYVSSAGADRRGELEGEAAELAGALFEVKGLGSKGKLEPCSRLAFGSM